MLSIPWSRGAVQLKAQRFLFQLCILRSFGNGALERLDQLGDGGEDRSVVGGKRGVTILQPALDRQSLSGMPAKSLDVR
jgi:hypothetical protein